MFEQVGFRISKRFINVRETGGKHTWKINLKDTKLRTLSIFFEKKCFLIFSRVLQTSGFFFLFSFCLFTFHLDPREIHWRARPWLERDASPWSTSSRFSGRPSTRSKPGPSAWLERDSWGRQPHNDYPEYLFEAICILKFLAQRWLRPCKHVVWKSIGLRFAFEFCKHQNVFSFIQFV
jgi:hypothetical protein